MLLEIIAETVEDALEAEQGGAGRIELVRDLSRGGLTPAPALVEAVVKAVRIPVRVMVRASEPFETPGAEELGRLRTSARHAIDAGAAGLVLGFLRRGVVDVDAVREIAGPVTGAVTFHRAFDEAARPSEAIAMLGGEPRVDRILTAGGTGPWEIRRGQLQALKDSAPESLTMLPGGGLDEEAVRDLAAHGFAEAHIGSAARVPFGPHGRVRATRVAELVAIADRSYLEG